MTHDELLISIDTQIITAPPFALGGYTRLLQALRAVVELHKPFTRDDDLIICNLGCNDEGGYLEPYPCPTIQAIEKEMG